MCMMGLMSMAMPAHMRQFIVLGDVFLRTQYTHWVYGEGVVGSSNPPMIGFGKPNI